MYVCIKYACRLYIINDGYRSLLHSRTTSGRLATTLEYGWGGFCTILEGLCELFEVLIWKEHEYVADKQIVIQKSENCLQ